MAEAKPAAASDLGSGFGGGFGDFNFAKMLDDVPGVAPESPSGGDSDPSA
jgi:hypothetical protein